MWEPRRLTNLWTFTACYRENSDMDLPSVELLSSATAVVSLPSTRSFLLQPTFHVLWYAEQSTLHCLQQLSYLELFVMEFCPVWILIPLKTDCKALKFTAGLLHVATGSRVQMFCLYTRSFFFFCSVPLAGRITAERTDVIISESIFVEALLFLCAVPYRPTAYLVLVHTEWDRYVRNPFIIITIIII
jgi:hypothetical protein